MGYLLYETLLIFPFGFLLCNSRLVKYWIVDCISKNTRARKNEKFPFHEVLIIQKRRNHTTTISFHSTPFSQKKKQRKNTKKINACKIDAKKKSLEKNIISEKKNLHSLSSTHSSIPTWSVDYKKRKEKGKSYLH